MGKETKEKRLNVKPTPMTQKEKEELIVKMLSEKAPKWMKKENVRRLWEEFKRDTNLINELEAIDIDEVPVRAFGVE